MPYKKDIYIYYCVSFLLSCVFLMPVWYFFFTSYLTFGVEAAIFITVLGGFVSMLFEIPSGAWADRYGRKKMYIIGIILKIISFTFFLFSESIGLFIISSIIGGLGYALTSGNIEAIIHDKIGKDEALFEKVQATEYIFGFIGRALSALVAGYMFIYNPFIPIYASITVYIFAMLFFINITDDSQVKSKQDSNYTHIFSLLKNLKNHPGSLYIIIFNGVLLSGIGNIYWYTYQPFLENLNFEIQEIGIIYFFLSLISAFGAYTIKKINLSKYIFITLKYLYFILFISALGFHFLKGFHAIIPILTLSFMFGFIMSLGNTYLIKHSKKHQKSTILSIFSLSISLAYFVFSNIAGYFSSIYGLEKVYFGLIFIILSIIIIDNFYIKKRFKLEVGN